MPWEETDNDIRHRLRDPEDFQANSFRTIALKKDKPRVNGIIGKLKGETSTTLQALRFPKDDGWTMASAKKWYSDHKDSFKSGEEIAEVKSVPVERKQLATLEIKDLKEDGTFSGIASAVGVEDLGGDVIDKGAFRKTLAEMPIVPLLWHHRPDEVIGEVNVREWQNKLMADGTLDLDDPTGQKAYGKLKKKLIKGLSIGFQAIKSTWEEIEKDGVRKFIRHIQEVKLWEISLVTFPMLPMAQVTRVKSADEEEIEQRIALLESHYQALTVNNSSTSNVQRSLEAGEDGQGAAKQAGEPDILHSAREKARNVCNLPIPAVRQKEGNE